MSARVRHAQRHAQIRILLRAALSPQQKPRRRGPRIASRSVDPNGFEERFPRKDASMHP